MKPAQILVILILLILAAVFFYQNPTMRSALSPKPTPTPIPAVSYEELEKLLITEKVPDDLPQNTLEIPQDKWGEKMPALAQRVLRFFTSQNVATKPAQEKIEVYQAFLKAWGKPWRVDYLMKNFDKEELALIWDELLLVQANTPEEISNQKKIVSETLAKVEPKPELAETDTKDHFKTQQDVDMAIAQGKLVELQTQNIKQSTKEYTVKPLVTIVERDLDPKLASNKDILEISSSTRSLKLQTLLKEKLGYLAAKVSYHTKGQAIDLKLSSSAKKTFDTYLSQKGGGGTTLLDRATRLYKQGTALTIANLVQNGILEKDNEVVKALLTVVEAMKGTDVDIIDETFFGVRFDKKVSITEINPVFHLQYAK